MSAVTRGARPARHIRPVTRPAPAQALESIARKILRQVVPGFTQLEALIALDNALGKVLGAVDA